MCLFVITVKEERIMAAIKNDSRKRGGRKVKKIYDESNRDTEGTFVTLMVHSWSIQTRNHLISLEGIC